MMNIGELSAMTHVSIRTLRHYDKLGLLKPSHVTESGYRQYDESALQRLHTILLFRELEFPLADIQRIIDAPDFEPIEALDKQITLLTMRREHIDNLILLAKGMKLKGMKHMDFSAFDARKIDDYAAQAKAAWGKTDAWKEFESRGNTREQNKQSGDALMALFADFGKRRDIDPTSDEAQQMVQQLRDFITANFYTCTVPVLRGLADMYDGGGDFTHNIDKAGGQGTAAFIAKAMRLYCEQNK
ncbi:MAG: MerR family transcriptional regulator [Clostridiales bacterium]|nr:MerR family transcriptional regulator [Clostridiales bacterium]